MSHVYKMTRYVLVGGFVFVLQFAALAVLVEIGLLAPLPASVVAFLVALISSFLLQRHVTFRRAGTDRMVAEFLQTVMLSFFNLGVNTLVIYFLLSINTHYLVAQVIATSLIVSYSYLVYHRIFRV